MKTCIVCSTPNNPLNKEISFHRFPRNSVLRSKWIEACGVQEKILKVKDGFICSKHFDNACYDWSRLPLKILLPESIPSQLLLTPTDKKKLICSQNLLKENDQRPLPPNVLPQKPVFLKDSFRDNAKVEIPDARYIGDLKPDHFNTPLRAKRHIDMIKGYVEEQRRVIKKLKKENERALNKINNMDDLLKNLQELNLLSVDRHHTILNSVPDSIKELLERQLVAKNVAYTPELKTFALTLHFYSPRAYSYVRSTFDKLLPHPATITKWYSVVNGEPGFSTEALQAINLRAKEVKGDKSIVVNVVLDEMSIRHKVEYSGKRFHGYVEIGIPLKTDEEYNKTEEATSAYVIMAVALNESWKIPIAYFLIKSLTAEERANLLTKCLILLQETGVHCHSITFDGAAVNISMCKFLGANYSLDTFKPYFEHPVTKENVYTFFDACHMLKLCRNTFCDKEILSDLNGFPIKWLYIKKLLEVQETQGLRAGNKLTKRHVYYKNEVMKVFLAAQTMSASVASALCLCKSIIPEFENCQPTANFCLVINNIFDILNCKNKFSKGQFNTPIRDTSFDFIKQKVEIYANYIKNLTDKDGHLILNSNRKTGFLGFIIDLTNLLSLYKDLKSKYNFEYILSFKLSQDHIETFFSAIRSRCGHNNNPSCLQFKASYKRLLVKHEISGSKYGNCSILDAATILHVSSSSKAKTNDTIILEEDLAEFELELNLEQELIFSSDVLTNFIEEVVHYISGFVVKKIKSKIICEVCCLQLTSGTSNSLLVKFKNRGNLTVASDDVIRLCLHLERLIRICFKTKSFTKAHLTELLTMQAMNKLPNLFSNEIMINHIKQQTVMDNHRVQMIKLISKIYINLRIHHDCKKSTEMRDHIRRKFNKIILFNNQ